MKITMALSIAYTVFMAKMFGEYLHSGYDGTGEYNVYQWDELIVHMPKHQCYTTENYERDHANV